MAERRIYLREWRLHRGFTQRQVIDRLEAVNDPLIPTTEASLSRIETGKQIYNQRILEALADIYDTEPENLIARNPGKEGELIDFLRPFGERKLKQMLAVLRAMDDRDDKAPDQAGAK